MINLEEGMVIKFTYHCKLRVLIVHKMDELHVEGFDIVNPVAGGGGSIAVPYKTFFKNCMDDLQIAEFKNVS